VPRGPAELAVGRRLEANLLLHPDRVADRLVLDRLQLLARNLAGRKVLAGLQQALRAK
jgi:hypothetical protein